MNVAEVAAAATVTEPAAVKEVLLLERETSAPPVGAALVNVTVQALEELGPRIVGVQASAETNTGATRLTLAVAELLL